MVEIPLASPMRLILMALLFQGALGCGSRPPDRYAPEAKRTIVAVKLGDLQVQEGREKAHRLKSPVVLSIGSTLRLDGVYSPIKLETDVPVWAQLTQTMPDGTPVVSVDAQSTDLTINDGRIGFQLDIDCPSESGDYAFEVRAGETRFVATGIVHVKPR